MNRLCAIDADIEATPQRTGNGTAEKVTYQTYRLSSWSRKLYTRSALANCVATCNPTLSTSYRTSDASKPGKISGATSGPSPNTPTAERYCLRRRESVFSSSLKSVATTANIAWLQAIEDDATRAVMIDKTRPSSSLKVSTTACHNGTVYARDWLFCGLDEAHKVRTQNACFTATSALRSISAFLVAMTATPITTSPKASSYFTHCISFADLMFSRISSTLGAALASATSTARRATMTLLSTTSALGRPFV